MMRFLVNVLSVCLLGLCGCDRDPDFGHYDSTCQALAPTSVQLPYDADLMKGEARLHIEAIPGRTDAVRVEARLHSVFEHPDKVHSIDWIQEGKSVKRIKIDNGRERYDFKFLEFVATGDTVEQVKIAVENQYKSGGR